LLSGNGQTLHNKVDCSSEARNRPESAASSWQSQSIADYLLTEHSWNNIQDFLSTTQAAVHMQLKAGEKTINDFHLDSFCQ